MIVNVMSAYDHLGRRIILTLYHAMDRGEFETVTNHVEEITRKPPEHPESYFR